MIEIVTEREIERKDVLEAFRTIKNYCASQPCCPHCPVISECHSIIPGGDSPMTWEVPDV